MNSPRRKSHFIRRIATLGILVLWALSVLGCTRLDAPRPKYVFLMIGDGMGLTHRYAAEAFAGAVDDDPATCIAPLAMSRFPVMGLATTYSENSFVTDSAAAGTALATGHKTRNGVLSMASDKKTPLPSVAELAKRKGMKVGIVTSVTINHATPGVFYSHQPSRSMYYKIATDLANSGFDYFGGGCMSQPRGKSGQEPSALEMARAKGFQIANTRQEMAALVPTQPAFAFSQTDGEPTTIDYEIDRPEDHISLAEFTQRGIELLENPEGFFMMVEGGKIDWAAHANDAATAIQEVLAFDRAIAKAVAFYEQHPRETLIVITSDHETGGLSLGYAGGGKSDFAALGAQKVSQGVFRSRFTELRDRARKGEAKFEDALPLVEECFGLTASGDGFLTLNKVETDALRRAFDQSVEGKKASASDLGARMLYGKYDPFSLELTRVIAHKAGMDWTTFGHTGTPVPVMALGAGQERFDGYYDNTQVPRRLMALIGVEPLSEKY